MIENPASFEEQKKRCRLIAELTAGYTLNKFTETGEWTGEKYTINLREWLFYCMAFFESGQKSAVRMANYIIKKLKFHFCHFSPMVSIQLIKKYPELLDKEAMDRLTGYVESVLDDFMDPEHDFVGVNDNFPCMATFISIIGGEMYRKPELYAKGIERLEQLKALLSRRGVASEYTSPTYSPIQLLAVAEIVNYAKDEKVKNTALLCEERLWADLMGHLHKETSQVAGPYSRAYTVDSTGHTHQARFILYAVLGEILPVNVINTLFASEKGTEGEVNHNSFPFLQISTLWIVNTYYHVPEYLLELALNKKYPYEFIATTEFSSSTDALPDEPPRDPYNENELFEYPAGNGRISTYMTEDYAVGASTHEFHNGVQTDSFHVLYRRKKPAVLQKDINTVYCRYIINEKRPTHKIYSFEDEGRKTGIQDKNSVMMLYKPKAIHRFNVSSLKLSILIPVNYGMVDEVWVGDQRLMGRYCESEEPCSVYIKDHQVYMAFHPLILTNYGRKAAVKVEHTEDYLMISFYNYEGEARDFCARGFLLTGNGFVAEVRSKAESGSFQSFMDSFKNMVITDKLQVSVHSRQTFIRNTCYERPGLKLACEYSPVSEGIKHMSVNGKELEQPKLYISGFDINNLPFI